MDAFEILVIVLSVLLGLVLLMGVVVAIFLIKIAKDIRHITQKASTAADNIGQAAQLFKNTSSLAAVTKLIGNAIESFQSRKPKGGNDE